VFFLILAHPSCPRQRVLNGLLFMSQVVLKNTLSNQWEIKCVLHYMLFTVVLFRLGYARITHGGLSDTEVQVGRFRIPHDVSSFADNEHITTDPQHVDKDVWFNSRSDGMLVGFALCTLHLACFGCVVL